MRMIVSAVLMTVAVGCTHDVSVPLRNAAPSPLNPRIVELDGQGNVLQTAAVGTLNPATQPAAQTTATIYGVHNGNNVQILADIPQGYQVFQSGQTTISSGQPKKISLPQVDLQINGSYLAPDEQAIQQLATVASDMGDVFDNLNVADLDSASKTYWGALIVMTPSVVDSTTHQITKHRHILFVVPSANFSTSLAPTTSFPGLTRVGDSNISGSAAISFSAQFPVFGGGSFNFTSNNVYKVHWELDNAGWLVRDDAPDFNPLDKLTQLDDTNKKQIYSYLNQNSDAMLMYVSEIYAVKQGSEQVTKGDSLAVGSKLNAGSVVTANGAYNFDSSKTQSVNIPSLLLNLGGVPFKPAFVQIAGANAGQTVANPTAESFVANETAIIPKSIVAPLGSSHVHATLMVPTVEKLRATIQKGKQGQ